jgi:hypothetical protein
MLNDADGMSLHIKTFYMKTMMLLSFLALMACTATGQVSAADSAIMTIKQLTNQWYAAVKSRDSVVIDRILADDYTVNGSWPKSKWMNNILHHFEMDSFEVAALPKFSYYDDAVLSQGKLYWKGTNEGKPFMNAEFSVTDIWVYRNERWQIHMRLLHFLKDR